MAKHTSVTAMDGIKSAPNEAVPSAEAKTQARDPLVDEHPSPLRIAIVGAGIGGLTAAIGLRRNGHVVDLYEQSSSANELGAAIHLAPNCNGILRRWGIYADTFGANTMDFFFEYSQAGHLTKKVDVRGPNKEMWQHPWLLCHRVNLHEQLKRLATEEAGDGTPARLHTSSKVVEVDADEGTVTLEEGKTARADVVLGVDGVYSRCRVFVNEGARLFPSGKAVFRFLIPREVAAADPVTAPLVRELGALSMWFGDDRRVVMYPCNDNEVLNFVGIHPDTESHATKSDEWSKEGSLDQVLKVYKDFSPALKALMSKVDPATLKVWQLLDMEKLSTWCNGKLALLGDAAHPFTPHQGQGAGQAMEDAAAITAVLPRGTAPEDVSERLKLYEKIRYDRAHMIQEYSRLAGKDRVDGKPQVDIMAYTAYNFGHDELDYAADAFKRWRWAQKPNMYWRQPVAFGPFPGPRQDHLGRRRLADGPGRRFCTASIKFRTSRTFLETLLPTGRFRFRSPATVCTASISATRLDGMAWLGGGGYLHCGLYVHGVEYRKRDGASVVGTYLPVLFENLADPVVSGREELGMPKLFCDIEMEYRREGEGKGAEEEGKQGAEAGRGAPSSSSSCRVALSWRGARFAEFVLPHLEEEEGDGEQGTIGGESDDGILTYRYVPAVGEPGRADAEYACFVPHAEEAAAQAATVRSVARSSDGGRGATVEIEPLDWEALPTLHHVTSVLAEIPVYGIVGAKVVEGTGVPDVSSCRRIE